MRWVCGIGLAAALVTTVIGTESESGSEALFVAVYRLEWDHWLWLERITRDDPRFLPEGFDVRNRRLRMVGTRSAREAYEACGIRLGTGETFIYGPETAQLISRLGPENGELVASLHRQVAAWWAGRTDRWRAGE